MTDPVAEFRQQKVGELDELFNACREERLDPTTEADNLVGRLRELHFLSPDLRGLVEHLQGLARQYALVDWSNNGIPLDHQPWRLIAGRLEEVLAEVPLYQRDWSQGPIQPQFSGAITGRIDLQDWAARARITSPRSDQIDPGSILTGAVNLFEHMSTSMLNSLEAPEVRDFEAIVDAIVNRSDAALDMLPAALTYFGANGVMVHNYWPDLENDFLTKLQEFAQEGLFDSEIAIPAGAPTTGNTPVDPRSGPANSSGVPTSSNSLTKGGNISLTKQAPDVTAIAVGLGWDARTTSGANFDLDASAIACGQDRQIVADEYFVFYNNLRSPDGSIVHTGDNRTGAGDGDDEVINVDLTSVPGHVTNIFFTVSIHNEHSLGLTFGQVQNAFIRVVDRSSSVELARYELSEDASTETAMVFGELYRRGAEWKFRAIGQGYASGLAGIARDYGISV